VESYNISVANALVLYHAFSDRMARQGTCSPMKEKSCEYRDFRGFGWRALTRRFRVARGFPSTRL
jgi:hypothetical protein